MLLHQWLAKQVEGSHLGVTTVKGLTWLETAHCQTRESRNLSNAITVGGTIKQGFAGKKRKVWEEKVERGVVCVVMGVH